MLLVPSEYRKYKALYNGLEGVPFRPVMAWKQYRSREHPLFVKYPVNMEDFLVGAKHSGNEVLSAVINKGASELGGKEVPKDSPGSEFLESVSSPIFFQICQEANAMLRRHSFPVTLTQAVLKNPRVVNIDVSLCSEDQDIMRSTMIYLNRDMISTIIGNILSYPNLLPKTEPINSPFTEIKMNKRDKFFGIASEVCTLFVN